MLMKQPDQMKRDRHQNSGVLFSDWKTFFFSEMIRKQKTFIKLFDSSGVVALA